MIVLTVACSWGQRLKKRRSDWSRDEAAEWKKKEILISLIYLNLLFGVIEVGSEGYI